MKVNGTLMNYYVHCQRQCYLHGNRINFEDNSENVKIGKALHENKYENDRNSEIAIENIRIDKITKDYLVETKKSDADVEASKWQLLYYLYVLKCKGIIKKGKLEFIQRNKDKKTIILELNTDIENEVKVKINIIEKLLSNEEIPKEQKKSHCKRCAYYDYCYI